MKQNNNFKIMNLEFRLFFVIIISLSYFVNNLSLNEKKIMLRKLPEPENDNNNQGQAEEKNNQEDNNNDQEQNPGENNDQEENPGEQNPGETNDQEENPGETNDQEENPGEQNPGETNDQEQNQGNNQGQSQDNNNNNSNGGNSDQKKDEDEKKYEECEGMTAYESTDCFEIELDFKKNIKKCCFIEYKDKKYDNKRRRSCTILTNDEFLDIKKKIKSIKESNKNITVLSLECDKSNILSLSKALLLILLLFPL